MEAVLYEQFEEPLSIQNVPDPTPESHGVVLEVKATGLCLSDWHGWMGHDKDIILPHVPGHELAGVIVAIGKGVNHFQIGDRVTLPFVCGCGNCSDCREGNQQICENQFQAGFTAWGSFAQYVAIDFADTNLVAIPDEINNITAASLGCRFATSFRGVVDQGQVKGGQWVAVHGCGGVGLSAIMIANALGANVIAIDIKEDKLDFARSVGAIASVNAQSSEDVVEEVLEISQGGVHVSIDALGNSAVLFNSISNLRKRGKHIQIGILPPDKGYPRIPIDKVIAHELEIYGSHGMQAYRYPAMLEMIKSGKLCPEKLIQKTISLQDVLTELPNMNYFSDVGIKVITEGYK